MDSVCTLSLYKVGINFGGWSKEISYSLQLSCCIIFFPHFYPLQNYWSSLCVLMCQEEQGKYNTYVYIYMYMYAFMHTLNIHIST